MHRIVKQTITVRSPSCVNVYSRHTLQKFVSLNVCWLGLELLSIALSWSVGEAFSVGVESWFAIGFCTVSFRQARIAFVRVDVVHGRVDAVHQQIDSEADLVDYYETQCLYDVSQLRFDAAW